MIPPELLAWLRALPEPPLDVCPDMPRVVVSNAWGSEPAGWWDADHGFRVGTFFQSPDRRYWVCVDATPGNAVWREVQPVR